MYATFSYDVTTGPNSVDEVRTAILDVFGDRNMCDLLADTLICEIADTSDFLALVRQLKKASKNLDDQFVFVMTIHEAGTRLNCNADFSKAKAKEIIGSGDDE